MTNIQYCYSNKLKLAYQTAGKPDDPAVIMIMGLGAQLTAWPEELCETIAQQEYYVIRFDNRDIGLSEKIEGLEPPPTRKVIAAGLFGIPLKTPYTLSDMTDDTIGLMDALNIQQAHIIGASMGGMIAQLMAIHHPDRVLSLCPIMSSSGRRGLPKGSPALLWNLIRPRPKSHDMDAALERLMNLCNQINGPRYRDQQDDLRERLHSDLKRSYYPKGVSRQSAAAAAAPSRSDQLEKLQTQTLVIHGTADPVIPFAHGIDLAKSIPGGKIKLFEGMGHSIPTSLIPQICEYLFDHFNQASENNLQALSA